MKTLSLYIIMGLMLIGIMSFTSATVTTTLNSPLNNSIQYTNNVNFNVTASSDTALLNNLTLYTNESGWTNVSQIIYSNSILSSISGYATCGETYELFQTIVLDNKTVDYISFSLSQDNAFRSPSALFTYHYNDSSTEDVGQDGAGSYDKVNPHKDRTVSSIGVYLKKSGSSGCYNVHFDGGTIYGGRPLSITDSINYLVTQNKAIKWNILSCDDISCSFAPNNYTISEFNIFENNRTFNSTAYETGYETYSINVTSNTSLTGINLLFNGTSYTTTQSGNIWSYSRDLPSSSVGNNSIYWNFTYSGNIYQSDTSYQYVNSTNFNLCNSTYTIPYLNLTFKDETSLLNINATIPTSTFTYYLGTGTVNKTLTFSNTSINPSYAFCGLPSDKTYHIDSYVRYASTGYPQRIWNPSLTDYTNSTTNQLLYLLSSSDGIYVTFQIINSADQTISGVLVTANRSIGGSDVTIGTGTTGDDGSITIWLSPDFITDFIFSKDGYTTYSTSFAPTQSGYTITLSGGGGTVPISYFKGINFFVTPTNQSLINNTAYNFGFLLTSSFWDVSNYGFNLRLVNGTIISGGSTGTEGTQLTLNYNTNNQTKIYLDYFWTINGTTTNGTKVWIVYNTDQTQWSIAYFFTDLKAYIDSGIFGLDNFGRYVIIFLVMFLVVGIMSYKYGLTSPLTVLLMIFLVVFFFDVVVGLIPTLTVANGHQVPYLLTFLSGLILIIFIFKEVYQ